MADDFRDEVAERLAGEEAFAKPGSRRAAEKARAEAQQPFSGDFADGFGNTAAAGAYRTIKDEAGPVMDSLTEDPNVQAVLDKPLLRPGVAVLSSAMSLVGFRGGEKDYDKEEKYPELTEGIPFEFHDDIMENDNFQAAARARKRVQDDLARGQRIVQQDTGQLTAMAGSLFDVDMPLTFFSGGAYGSAKVARTALVASQLGNLSTKASLRLSGAAQGFNAGLQAGALVGAVDAASRESVGWQDVANMALMSAGLGVGIGGATKGDVRVSIRAAHDDFLEKIARNDKAYTDELNVNDMPSEPILFERVEEGSIGAAQANPIPNASQLPPVAGASPTNQLWIDAAKTWRTDTGWKDAKNAASDRWWAKVAQSPFMNLTTNNFNRLYKSESAVANFVAGSVFESANSLGRGKATAATRMENYHKRIQAHLGDDLRAVQAEWAKTNDATWQGSGYHISEQGKAVFNREVMLELNDRALGRNSTRSPEIQRAADQYELAGAESLGIGRGREGELPVDGFEALPDRRGYTPYMWNGRKIEQLIKDGVVDEAQLTSALANGYRQAGMAAGKDADAVAKAVLHRARTKANDVDMSVLSMMSGDGKDFMREAMVSAGMREAEADSVIQRLTGAQHERGKESFAKSRNDVDMGMVIPTLDGSDLRVVDLFDNDLHGVWQRYARQMSGSAALARQGITNRAKRKEVIAAMQAEQRALGEDVMDTDLLEAMFSHFNAGPIHGFAANSTNEGIGHMALAKRIANLALLEKLGVTQIAETGVIIAQNGLANWMQRGPMALLDKELRAGNQAMLDDLAFFAGEIGKDHWHFAPWLDLDDVPRSERAWWVRGTDRASQLGSFVQGYTSAFNNVRSFQQKTAALGMSDKVLRELKKAMDEGRDLTPEARERFAGDFGLDQTDFAELYDLIDSGVIQFETRGKNTFVNRLNMEQWPVEVGENFAAAITRNMNQLVQKSMAGEQDAWMHTHAGSILMHLKTFPLQAMQKQVMRNARFMDKQALSTVLYGMATAAVAIKMRDALDGRERSAADTAKATFSYSNMTGWIPTIYDPMMTLIGMDSARINAYGPAYDLTPPTVKMANHMMRIPGAVGNTIAGNADWYDEQGLRAIPFAGTYVLSRLFD